MGVSPINIPLQYIREVFHLVGDDMAYSELGKMILHYSQLWMRFVLEKCDGGTGVKPRCGNQEGKGEGRGDREYW